MLRVGPFTFSIGTAAYQLMTREDRWRWKDVQVINGEVQRQYTGPGNRTIVLKGVVFTHMDNPSAPFAAGAVVGTGHMQTLRDMGDMGVPLPVTDGRGRYYGKWVMAALVAKSSEFLPNGAEKKQQFDLTLAYYPEKSYALSFGFGISLDVKIGGITLKAGINKTFTARADGNPFGFSITPSTSVQNSLALAGIGDPSKAYLSAGFTASTKLG